jgi:hypothetical protein
MHPRRRLRVFFFCVCMFFSFRLYFLLIFGKSGYDVITDYIDYYFILSLIYFIVIRIQYVEVLRI